MKPRGLRARLWLTVAIGSAVVIAISAGGFNLLLANSLSSSADKVARERAEAALETIVVRPDGTIRLIEAPAAQDAGTGIWVFDGDKELERPPGVPAVQLLAKSLAGESDTFADDDASDTRLFARAIRDAGGRQVGTVVASLSLQPYEDTAHEALVASLAFSVVIWLGILIVSWFVLNRALRPVARMTREATEWSEHDLDHRFAAGKPYDEITELAAAFDSMLNRLASSLRHEQRFSAEVSHELRTPLAAILAEVELELRKDRADVAQREVLERIGERARALNGILETLLAVARAEGPVAPASTLVLPAVERVGEAATSSPAERDVTFGIDIPREDLAVDADAALVERVLAPVVENALRFAESSVVVTAASEGESIAIRVSDDGPGVSGEEAERIFEPGVRGEAAQGRSDSGAGLGLALSRRLAQAAAGELSVEPARAESGATFVVRLPVALGGSLATGEEPAVRGSGSA